MTSKQHQYNEMEYGLDAKIDEDIEEVILMKLFHCLFCGVFHQTNLVS